MPFLHLSDQPRECPGPETFGYDPRDLRGHSPGEHEKHRNHFWRHNLYLDGFAESRCHKSAGECFIGVEKTSIACLSRDNFSTHSNRNKFCDIGAEVFANFVLRPLSGHTRLIKLCEILVAGNSRKKNARSKSRDATPLESELLPGCRPCRRIIVQPPSQ